MSNMAFKKINSWIPVLIWMGVIFYLSHQPASESSELSASLAATILYMIEVIIPVDPDYFHHFVRKSAHFFAYFILGILVVNAFRVTILNMQLTRFLFVCCTLSRMRYINCLFQEEAGNFGMC